MNVYIGDTEYVQPDGEPARPLCVAIATLDGQIVSSQWIEGGGASPCPIPPGATVMAYMGTGDLACWRAMGWPEPTEYLDLYAEYRVQTNHCARRPSAGLLAAAEYFGIDTVTSRAVKDRMHALCTSRRTFSAGEQAEILRYCEEDARIAAAVAKVILERIDNMPQALLRGAYVKAISKAEERGIPVDKRFLDQIAEHREALHDRILDTLLPELRHLYPEGKLSIRRLEQHVNRLGLPWPVTETGRLSLDRDTFKDMALLVPDLQPLADVQDLRRQLASSMPAIGVDGRNRALSGIFGTRTGRNRPNGQSLVIAPGWLRRAIRPEPGRALAYVDFEQQELAIAAALSGDATMIAAYESGDFYLDFARRTGAAPADATKETHGRVRDLYKQAALGVLYGIAAPGLARRLGVPEATAALLLREHRRVFSQFWAWSAVVEDRAIDEREIRTKLGWRMTVDSSVNPRALLNWPMQAHGAELLRASVVAIAEAGVEIVGTIHDAVLIEADIADIDEATATVKAEMARVSRTILNGLTVRAAAKIIRPGESFPVKPKHEALYQRITNLLNDITS